MVTPIDWTEAVTLEEHVYQLFRDGKTDTDEFKTLVRFFGRQKMIEFWKQWQNQLPKDPLSQTSSALDLILSPIQT
jgi:hypothetical protein